jgi:hypothetical protein
MVYMGTATHDADFEMIVPALDRLWAKHRRRFKLTLVGAVRTPPERPWLEVVPAPGPVGIYPRFVRWFLRQGRFDVGLSPLVDSPFNRCKSDIKCLDYWAAGALPVVSDIEPYRTAAIAEWGMLVPNTVADWERSLAEVVRNGAEYRAKAARGTEYVWRERTAQQSGAHQSELIARLVACS